ncbi:hypothetical protein DFA_06791 [Cavenderia fasciculata]|uniref:EGF-like domain-containing protein n=1 Tax=Cavenderia fasciculata TaxID=261658 RepID=F4Q2A4_CACFS|nr:uncharacterized protein DFA_06791 [Cavenderia fasciculata]EGG18124.1 hypothetical protein DFA_06791 [Cavenderia fasciculata]|eukprot:XP_004366165.1 hypothetical protein DFA_06791 [Cavenderia fasciculata]
MSIKLLLVLSISIFILFSPIINALIPTTDPQYSVLNSISSAASNQQSQWTSNDIQQCTARGVLCNTDKTKVISLVLDEWYTGKLISDISQLSSLQVLYLKGNGIGSTMSIPTLPKSLNYITIINTLFQGIVPRSISSSSLVSLTLSNNKGLTDMSTVDFLSASLNQLNYINITNNINIKSMLPNLADFNRTGTIIISGNGFTGGLPSLFNLIFFDSGKLKATVDLSNNRLQGVVPPYAYCISKSNSSILNLSGNIFSSTGLCNPNLNVISPNQFTDVGTGFLVYGVAFNEIVSIYDDVGPLSCSSWISIYSTINCKFNRFKASSTGYQTIYYGPDKQPFYLPLQPPIVESATTVSSKTGGQITVVGYNFPPVMTSLLITVDNVPCKNTKYSLSQPGHGKLICLVAPSLKTITDPRASLQATIINPNNPSSNFTGSNYNFLLYQDVLLGCLNNCNGNGECVMGQCKCIDSFTGPNCSIPVRDVPSLIESFLSNDTSNGPSIIAKIGNATIQIQMTSVQEYNVDGDVVKNISLATNKIWYKTILYASSNSYYFYGSINGGKTNISASVQLFSNDTVYVFGNEKSNISRGSIKFSFNISNWDWTSTISTLQVLYSTSININGTLGGSTSSSSSLPSNCKPNNNRLDLQQVNDPLVQDSLKYASFKNRQFVVNSRFTNRAIIDGRFLNIKNKIANTSSERTTYGILVPHFESSAQIDPDFSLILSDNADINNNGDDTFTCSTAGGLSTVKLVSIVVVCGLFIVSLAVGTIIYVKFKKRELKSKRRVRNATNAYLASVAQSTNTATTAGSSSSYSSSSSSITVTTYPSSYSSTASSFMGHGHIDNTTPSPTPPGSAFFMNYYLNQQPPDLDNNNNKSQPPK